jgi:hypothetical protein
MLRRWAFPAWGDRRLPRKRSGEAISAHIPEGPSARDRLHGVYERGAETNDRALTTDRVPTTR